MSTKYNLFPHQEECVRNVIEKLKTNDRCHIVMACGTGKTLISLSITEKLQPKTTIIFMPSLALISQFMNEWVKNNHFNNFSILTVCSDKSITNDYEEQSILYNEVSFPVTRNVREIERFLSNKEHGIKIIFCTYQSSRLLKDLQADLAIYDEAHRTAGFEKKHFSITLDNNYTKITKRIFMTATPRIGSPVQNKDGDFKTLFSMDDVRIYGPRAYTLGFRKAINLDLICDYKIIISVIEDKYSHKFNEQYEMQEKLIALNKAIKKTKSNKIISFHSSIDSASRFNDYNNSYNTLIKSLHISSRINMKKRTIIMDSFKKEKRCLITNSRCLTEGIDVPAVDMVAFMHPKSSKIDIVQAIGRCLRKSKNKQRGYIFLPLFIDESEINEIDNTEYSHIWEVLLTLMEQDSNLEDIVKNLSKKHGHNALPKNYDFGEFITILSNKNLQSIIKTKILEHVTTRWDKWLADLISYKEKFGHCLVSESQKEYGLLYHWILNQRKNYKCNILKKDRIDRLNNIGFNWAPKDTIFYQNYKIAKKFYERTGHLRIKTKRKDIYKWLDGNRRSYQNGTLTQDRIDALNAISFDLSAEIKDLKNLFDKNLQDLKDYGSKIGEINLKDSDKNRKLVIWLQSIRSKYLRGKLTKDQITKLEESGVALDIYEYRWDEKLNKYHKEKSAGELSNAGKHWISGHKRLYKNWHNLIERDKNRLGKLIKHGMFIKPINPHISEEAENHIEHLKKYYIKNGNYDISYKKNVNLYNWTNKVRRLYKMNKIDKELEKELNSINFTWERELQFSYSLWLKTYEQYCKYHHMFGKKYSSKEGIPKKILLFAQACRARYNKGKLDEKRLQKLNEINFDFKIGKYKQNKQDIE